MLLHDLPVEHRSVIPSHRSDEEAALLGWFSAQFDVLVEKFEPSLRLKRLWRHHRVGAVGAGGAVGGACAALVWCLHGAHEQSAGSAKTARQRGGWLHRAVHVGSRLQRRGAASIDALRARYHRQGAWAGQTAPHHCPPSHKRRWPEGAGAIKEVRRSGAVGYGIKTLAGVPVNILGRQASSIGRRLRSHPGCWSALVLRRCPTSRAAGRRTAVARLCRSGLSADPAATRRSADMGSLERRDNAVRLRHRRNHILTVSFRPLLHTVRQSLPLNWSRC
jgi:hypothetical protein